MNFDDLKDQLTERLQEIWSKIQESESFIILKERYDNLNPNAQQAIIWGAALFAFYIIYSIPAGFVDSSNELEEYFVENRQLTRDLIRAGRIERNTQMPPQAPNFESLKQQATSAMTRERVLEEQKRPPKAANNIAPASLVPKSIKQNGLKLGAKKLNLRQTIKIAESLSNINSSRLMNMYIQADGKDPHYFSVDYEVASFSLPITDTPKKDDKKKKSKFKSRNKKKNTKKRK